MNGASKGSKGTTINQERINIHGSSGTADQIYRTSTSKGRERKYRLNISNLCQFQMYA